MRRERAEGYAAAALDWLAGQDEAMARWLGLSGLEIEDLKARADQPELLGSVVGYLSEDEELARGFCEAHGLSPEQFAAIRAALPGGDAPHWL